MPDTHKSVVYVVSDAAGDTGEAVVKAAAAQFHPLETEVRRIPFVDSIEVIDVQLGQVQEQPGIVVFTLVIPELRDHLIARCMERNIPFVDILGPVVSGMEQQLGQKSKHVPGVIHRLDEDYFKKVEAVEFAVKYDDGRDPSGIVLADLVLVGVSRTSKTPLTMYLAHKKYKVANVPLVPEIIPPEQLFSLPKERIIGLTIDPGKLNSIRRERLRHLGLADDAQYANAERIKLELNYSEQIFERLGCTVIDVSNKAVEETASMILESLEDSR
ncbi:kinase/pyrophosphorylase [Xylanibacillus composti]|uniref:Putative pyruvate, phosphate dikinase regulatory protein n=1 Tax=Xylanibacillus composti TaxID=1572762 RepID=A0A8J4H245_9BACL|nr:pyruvate, water dikinase regulatory protein [Xylanibacillus composti]MDT9724411.1 kinase/pyrophosphorylase [Xylanibacillus composti]GIQ68007.1 putative pyruvate, phosphate dikinase regulatory protein [Xylanibacillus composti]